MSTTVALSTRRSPSPDHLRLVAQARAALDALLAQSADPGGGFYGKIAVEISLQNGRATHVREVVERVRK